MEDKVVQYAAGTVLNQIWEEDFLGFSYGFRPGRGQPDALERFLEQLQERLRKFGLELHPEKTRLIEFGRYAAERREKREEGKPETFNFLGFTHICGTNHKTGKFTVHRRTIGKRMAAKLKEIRAKLRQRLPGSPQVTGKWLGQVVRGYFQYHAIPGNWARLKAYRNDVLRICFKRFGGEASVAA